MKRQDVKGVWLGKKNIILKGQLVKISVYIDEIGEFCMFKGKRINLFSKDKKWVVK